jgi:hypothetical protein
MQLIDNKDKYEPIIRYVILSLIGLAGFAYLYVKLVAEPNKLKEDYRYTIGKIDNVGFPAEGDQMADVKYFVNGKEYNIAVPLDGTKPVQPKVGQRYIVKYHSPDPSISKVDLNSQVSDSAINIPANGWESNPFETR